jgi:hypothetical protein
VTDRAQGTKAIPAGCGRWNSGALRTSPGIPLREPSLYLAIAHDASSTGRRKPLGTSPEAAIIARFHATGTAPVAPATCPRGAAAGLFPVTGPVRLGWGVNHTHQRRSIRLRENVASDGQAKQKQASKRSLRAVNEHSEPVSNAA